MRIRKGDMVVILAGDDRPRAGRVVPHKVIQVLDGGKRLVIEGVNSVFRHVRRGHPKSPSGGRLGKDLPIDSSNVALYCNSCHKGARIGYRLTADGAKERFCRKCGAAAGTVGAPRKPRTTA